MSWLGQLPPQELFTYDRHGTEYQFSVHYSDHNFPAPTDFTAYVYQGTEWPPDDFAWYEVSVNEQTDGKLQTVNMNNNNQPHLSRKGIGVALLPAISRLVKRDIVSSPTFQDLSQRRSADATRVWNALVELKLATPEGDRSRLHFERAVEYSTRRK
jgi:hypothetical protein